MKTDPENTKRRARTLARNRGHVPGSFGTYVSPGHELGLMSRCNLCGGQILAMADGQTSVPRLCRIRE